MELHTFVEEPHSTRLPRWFTFEATDAASIRAFGDLPRRNGADAGAVACLEGLGGRPS